jgi:ribosome-associated protein
LKYWSLVSYYRSVIIVTPDISIDESELQEEFIRASGPGGQNVNKVATSVQLRFDLANSKSLPEEVRKRLISLAGNRVTENGVLIIEARRFRNQGQNRKDAIERLVKLVHKAAETPNIRHKTRPTLGSKIRRLDAKRIRARSKQLRVRVNPGNE